MTSIVNFPVFHPRFRALALSILVGLSSQMSRAQEQMILARPTLPSVQGLAGPATIKLSDVAELAIPAGCKYVDPEHAPSILRAGVAAPKNLAGIIMPDSRAWFSIVQYADVGYVSDADQDHLNPAALLKTIRGEISKQNKQDSKMGASPIMSADWLVPPAYNASQNTLEYAVKMQGKDGSSINFFSSLLGRRGVLSLTTVLQSESDPELSQLKEIMKGLSFKPGERYADHQPQDRLASANLGELIASHNNAGGASGYSTAQIEMIGLGVAGGLAVIVVAGFLTSFALRRRKARYYRVDGEYAQHTNGNGHVAVNGRLSRHARRQRRKMFSYHAFYSDMVMNLTSSGYNGSAAASFRSGQSNGHADSNGNGHHEDAAIADGANLLVTETSKLIESQQKLIEGQRRLIEAQSKLIQEKNQLLNAEAKILEKQAELLTDQQLQ